MEPPPEKTTFPLEFLNYLYTICIYTNHNHISGKKIKIFVPFQNGGQITDFHFASFQFRPKFEKPLSQRNFPMKFGSNKEIMNTSGGGGGHSHIMELLMLVNQPQKWTLNGVIGKG